MPDVPASPTLTAKTPSSFPGLAQGRLPLHHGDEGIEVAAVLGPRRLNDLPAVPRPAAFGGDGVLAVLARHRRVPQGLGQLRSAGRAAPVAAEQGRRRAAPVAAEQRRGQPSNAAGSRAAPVAAEQRRWQPSNAGGAGGNRAALVAAEQHAGGRQARPAQDRRAGAGEELEQNGFIPRTPKETRFRPRA